MSWICHLMWLQGATTACHSIQKVCPILFDYCASCIVGQRCYYFVDIATSEQSAEQVVSRCDGVSTLFYFHCSLDVIFYEMSYMHTKHTLLDAYMALIVMFYFHAYREMQNKCFSCNNTDCDFKNGLSSLKNSLQRRLLLPLTID